MNIDKVETQTEHQEEMSALISANRMNESVDEFLAGLKVENEWNGEGLPPVGAIYTLDPNHDVELLCKYSSKYVVIGEMLPKERYNGVEVVIDTFAQRDRVFRKPETPQQREERERLECIKKMYIDGNVDGSKSDLLVFSIEGILANLYDAGYRKGVK
ncbi:hypothetical protein NVP1201B_30 [Vibrio phage 1.201.B._10N.286.55.F1]|nr:hypothetical protein NVP1201B_30 [Vibrio phage 1.201.B._10N.286.55.F1]